MDDIPEQSTSLLAGPRSATRVMDILVELAKEPAGLPLARICGALKLPKTSTYSLLKALEHGEYVSQAGGKYVLGPESFRMAAAISQQRRFPELIRPIVENLARESGETVLVGVMDDNGVEIRYVDVCVSRSALRFIVGVGDKRPLYSSTTGKILLAYFARPRLEDYLANVKRVPFTSKTLVKRADILAEINLIRDQIWASNIDGTTEGITSYGAPIFENDRFVVGAIVIAGPEKRMQANAEAMRNSVLEAAAEASRLLNCKLGYPPASIQAIE